MKILVEEGALESIKRMAQQLQDERDELLSVIQVIYNNNDYFVGENGARNIIAKCTAKPEVLE